MFKRIFYLLLGWVGVQKLRGHSFFGILLADPAVVVDAGAHRGEFFAALKSEYPISRALLIEANPALIGSLKETFGNEVDVLHAALVGGHNDGLVAFTRSTNAEASTIFSEWAAAYGIADRVDVPAVDLSHVTGELGGRVDLVKLDVEGAEIDVLQTASTTDLASCGQLTVEFHHNRPPITRRDIERVCERLRCEGYAVVNANWPYVDDVLFVNVKTMPVFRGMAFRCRVMLANVLFIIRRVSLDRLFAKGR